MENLLVRGKHQQHTDLVDLKKKQECIIVKKKTFFFRWFTNLLARLLLLFFVLHVLSFFFFSSYSSIIHFVLSSSHHHHHHIAEAHTTWTRAANDIFLSSSWQRTSSAHKCECGYFLRQRDEKRKKKRSSLGYYSVFWGQCSPMWTCFGGREWVRERARDI